MLFIHCWTFCLNLKEKSDLRYFWLIKGIFSVIFFLTLSTDIKLQWNVNYLIRLVSVNYQEKNYKKVTENIFMYIYYNTFVRRVFIPPANEVSLSVWLPSVDMILSSLVLGNGCIDFSENLYTSYLSSEDVHLVFSYWLDNFSLFYS